MRRADVLVAGAGPVGLTAALALVSGGASVDLVEARPAPSGESLAATFHPPTLQILAGLGIDLAGRGLLARTIGYRNNRDRVVARFLLAELADLTDHPYRCHLPQLQMCQMILDRLRDFPQCRITLGQRVTPETTGDYRWVFAADGSGSALRDAAGVGFIGEDYAGTVVRLICDPAGFDGWDPVTYVLGSDRSVSVLQMADHVRVIVRVGEDVPAVPDIYAEAVRTATAVAGIEPVVRSWSPYRSQRRVATTNLVGNLIFVGDSAHVTTTRGGMNMNAGIHDAAVIATALLREPDSLAEVARQRLAVAREMLLPRTHETLDDPGARLRRILDLRDDPTARREFLRRSAMLDMVDLVTLS